MKTKAKGKILAILMSLAMVFTMMPLISQAAYADDPVYTVTIDPGEGTGTAFTVQSTTICNNFEEFLEWDRGTVDKEKGCFYRDGEKVFYVFPKVCSFTAPENKEFSNWKFIIGDAYQDLFDGGTHFDLTGTLAGGATSFTLIAQWKDVEPDPSIEYSTPEAINVNYEATRTAFDIQVTDASFTQGETRYDIRLCDSTFTCSENGGSIPFTMNGEIKDSHDGRSWNPVMGDFYYFYLHNGTDLPYTVQAYIDISSDDWAAAEPGEYTATLKINDNLGGARNIPLTLTVPDKSIEHTVTVTNNGNGTASADPQSGTWGTEVTLTATPNPGCVFKEWQVISGGVTVSNDKFTIGTDDVEIKAIFVKPVDVPEGKTLTYNGEEQSGVEAGEGYELINASATNADSYEATATLKDGYVWADDGTTAPKAIKWKINKRKATVGKPTLTNVIAKSADRTNTGYWRTVSGATSYDFAWREKGGKWSVANAGKTYYKTVKNHKSKGLYEYKVRARRAETATDLAAVGSYSNVLYRYFFTLQHIRILNEKGGFTVKWAKDSNATGYQVLYSTNKDGSNPTVITLGSNSITSRTVKGLKSGKVYYVQIRPIKKVGGTNYIGNNSVIKPVKAF